MLLEGVVTNVAAFGAFVDVGVHQDGLVHISAMSRTRIDNPRDVVKPGDVVRVKVLDVDVPRKRISLTLRLEDEPDRRQPRGVTGERDGRGDRGGSPAGRQRGGRRGPDTPPPGGAMADALRRAGLDTGRQSRPGRSDPR